MAWIPSSYPGVGAGVNNVGWAPHLYGVVMLHLLLPGVHHSCIIWRGVARGRKYGSRLFKCYLPSSSTSSRKQNWNLMNFKKILQTINNWYLIFTCFRLFPKHANRPRKIKYVKFTLKLTQMIVTILTILLKKLYVFNLVADDGV